MAYDDSRRFSGWGTKRLAHDYPPVRPDPDVPDDPDREQDLPDVNPGSNPDNPGDQPAVTEPGRPARIVA